MDFSSLLSNPLIQQYLLAMGAGMAGAPSLGAGFSRGLQAGNAAALQNISQRQDAQAELEKFKQMQEMRSQQARADFQFENDAKRTDEERKAIGSMKLLQDTLPEDVLRAMPAETINALGNQALASAFKSKGKFDPSTGLYISPEGKPDYVISPERKAEIEAAAKQEEALRANAEWERRNAIEFSQKNDIEGTKAGFEVQKEQRKLLPDLKEQEGKYKYYDSKLKDLATLQTETTTGPILGSDPAIKLRAMLPGGDNVQKLNAGYSSVLADLMLEWKGNPTDAEREFMKKAQANMGNDEEVNLELLKEAMVLNEQRLSRVQNQINGITNSSSSNVGKRSIRPGYVPFGGR